MSPDGLFTKKIPVFFLRNAQKRDKKPRGKIKENQQQKKQAAAFVWGLGLQQMYVTPVTRFFHGAPSASPGYVLPQAVPGWPWHALCLFLVTSQSKGEGNMRAPSTERNCLGSAVDVVRLCGYREKAGSFHVLNK
jgi:hypothetical protein